MLSHKPHASGVRQGAVVPQQRGPDVEDFAINWRGDHDQKCKRCSDNNRVDQTEILMSSQTHLYQLLDWSKPPPVVPEKQLQLTVHEAHNLNRGMVMNGLTKRWVKQDSSSANQ